MGWPLGTAKSNNDEFEEDITMTKTINTEITFELFGATYTRKANGYCYMACEQSESGKIHRIGKAEFEAKYAEFQCYEKTLIEIENEEAAKMLDDAAENPEVSVEEFCEMVASSEAPKAHESAPSTEGSENTTPKAKSQKKAKKTAKKAKKNAAYSGHGITLTEKQVDFMHHLPDTCFWEDGLDSIIWVDCLCDEIGGQFEGKPMTVGAMISTICEKGLGSRGSDRREGRKCTSFALTDLGKLVAMDLGLN